MKNSLFRHKNHQPGDPLFPKRESIPVAPGRRVEPVIAPPERIPAPPVTPEKKPTPTPVRLPEEVE